MTTVRDLCQELERIAPLTLAESWDNVGLLVGDPNANADRTMTCLTISRATVQEAIAERACMIVSHHPLPFQPLKRLTTDSIAGELLWQLIGSHIAVYSPHTAWDSAEHGINQQTADLIGLRDTVPLKPLVGSIPLGSESVSAVGIGRVGELCPPLPACEIARLLSALLPNVRPRFVGNSHRQLSRIGILCGSGGSLISLAAEHHCEAVISGEATYHQCLEAEALGIDLILIGHYASERFAMDRLVQMLTPRFPKVTFWASRQETDPVSL